MGVGVGVSQVDGLVAVALDTGGCCERSAGKADEGGGCGDEMHVDGWKVVLD